MTEELLDAPWPVTLWLRPANLVLGVSCKRGVPHERIKAASDRFIGESEVSPLSISAIASVDIKRDEPGLIELAAELGVPFVTFSAERLKEARGDFIASERVAAATGVDNVCERAAVLESGGFLLRRKTKYEGIRLALAKRRRDGLWK